MVSKIVEGRRGGGCESIGDCSFEDRLRTSFLPRLVLLVGTNPSLLGFLNRLKLLPREVDREGSAPS